MKLSKSQKIQIKKRAKRIMRTYRDYKSCDKKVLMFRAMRYILKYGGYRA